MVRWLKIARNRVIWFPIISSWILRLDAVRQQVQYVQDLQVQIYTIRTGLLIYRCLRWPELISQRLFYSHEAGKAHVPVFSHSGELRLMKEVREPESGRM
ncbi:hypothetical protein BDW22DRAFT_709992 [Trametopsis cervina]|nr:hypothetical protein BDW22DRAFT_709992 [Trametopsis cervina]